MAHLYLVPTTAEDLIDRGAEAPPQSRLEGQGGICPWGSAGEGAGPHLDPPGLSFHQSRLQNRKKLVITNKSNSTNITT